VISPHLDDAVLSLGGTIARWVDEGARVVVATVYTAGPPLEAVPPSMRPFADYETRCREDAAALEVVGAEARRLGQIERAFRPPFVTWLQAFSTPPSREGFAELRAVRTALDQLAELSPEIVALPLGVGNHVDHVEVMVAATDWVTARGIGDRVRFYEDLYAVSGTMRRRRWVTRRRRWPPWRAPLLSAPRLAALLVAAALARRGPAVEAYLTAPWREAAWSVEPSTVRVYEDQKLAAVACYASQVRAFGGMRSLARVLRAYHRRWQLCEPLWRAEFS
jgi:LmbE family N-acetylglucosaminyl deacetylase